MDKPANAHAWRRALSLRGQLLLLCSALCLAAVGGFAIARARGMPDQSEASAQPVTKLSQFLPGRQQLAALQIQTVPVRVFHTEIVTDGYIAPNGGVSAPGASPEQIARSGSPVPVGQSSDLVQAETDFAAAHGQFVLAQANEKRQHALYLTEGAAQKDWQQSQADLASAAASISAARSRLRLLGRSDRDIEILETTLTASGASGRALFSAGGKGAVWLVANVREEDVPLIHFNDKVEVRIPALPDSVFNGVISYMASVIDPNTHRLVVGAVIPSASGILRPNMLASVTIDGGAAKAAPAIPRNAIVFEGDQTRVWLETAGGNLESRAVTLGRTDGDLIEITGGLKGGERIVTGGALFLDQASKSG